MKYVRIPVLIILIAGILILGYFRERYLLLFSSETVFTFIRKYPRVSATNFKNEISNFWMFHFSPKLLSVVLYSVAFAALTSLIVYLLTKNRLWGYLILVIYAMYFVVCFLLIAIGNLGVDYHLSYGLSHYIEDLFLSPFILMMLLPLLFFQKRRNTLEKK